jgi:hypothetical protein
LLRTELCGARFSAQVAAAASLEATAKGFSKLAAVTKDATAIRYAINTATSIANYLRSSVLGKQPEVIRKGTKTAAAEAAAIAIESLAAAKLAETNRLAAEFEALGGGVLTMALAKAAAPGDPLRECWLARERLRMSEGRSIDRAEILTARTDAAAEAALFSAAEPAAAGAAAAEASAAAGRRAAGNEHSAEETSKNYQLHLHRSKVTHEPESISEAGSAGTEGRAYVMRIDNHAINLRKACCLNS